ncbi:hypothetical protein [Geomicrobium sp. JCM 19055]|nr:hypothetical protein [Geomicrobium sp. JCM 19055]
MYTKQSRDVIYIVIQTPRLFLFEKDHRGSR